MSDRSYSRTYTCRHEAFNILLTLSRILLLLRAYGAVTAGANGSNHQHLITGDVFYGVNAPFRIYAYHGSDKRRMTEDSLWCKVIVEMGKEQGKYEITIELTGPEFEASDTYIERSLIGHFPNLKLV